MLTSFVKNAFPNQDRHGFAMKASRLAVDGHTLTMYGKPTTAPTVSLAGNHLEDSCALWPATEGQKRMVFVDLASRDFSGTFYIGTYIRHPEKQDKLLEKSAFASLSKEVCTSGLSHRVIY